MGKINSTRFGEIVFDDDKVITMPNGIIGFSEHKKYILVHREEDALFLWLHSVDDPELAFVVTDPRHFISDYQMQLTDDEREFLQLKDESEIGLLVLVTIPEGDPGGITANMLAPVIYHMPSSRAWQVVLEDVDYDIRYPLIPPDEYEGEAD